MQFSSSSVTLVAASVLAAACVLVTSDAAAVSSAELYQTQTYTYGRFEARLRFPAGDGVIGSFFLWKPGSEVAGTFWNELDFEKIEADCRLQTNPLYGLPVADHGEVEMLDADLCGEYHTYTFEWTPTYIAYLVDGVEVRRDAEDVATAFAENAASGMQIHFNIWPGDETFGGTFDAAILPVQQYISWVQYSSFADGEFTLEWREELDGPTLPSGWAVGNWASPKNLSNHQPANVVLTSGLAVLALTADDATGFAGTAPPDMLAGAGGTEGAAGAGDVPPAGAGSGGAAGAPEPTGSAGTAPSVAPEPASNDGGCSVVSRGASAGVSSRAVWLLLAVVAMGAARRRRVTPMAV